jgi:hypothetical protein
MVQGLMPFIHKRYHETQSYGPEKRLYRAIMTVFPKGPEPEEIEAPVSQDVYYFPAV